MRLVPANKGLSPIGPGKQGTYTESISLSVAQSLPKRCRLSAFQYAGISVHQFVHRNKQMDSASPSRFSGSA